jgi:hypothetical protein
MPERGWTPDTLYTHFTARFEDSNRAVENVAKDVKDKFASVNEFRGTLSDQATHLMPRAECDARFRSLESKLDQNTSRIDNSTGMLGGRSQGFAAINAIVPWIAVITSVATFAYIIFHH